MEVSFENWLQAQLAREDSVGKIARSWLEFGLQKPSGEVPFPSWWDSEGVINYHEEDHQLALSEYDAALTDLKAGISPESFPSAMANKGIMQSLDKCGDWHSKNPDLTSAEYLWIRQRDLWEFVKSQTTLYLDTGYWIGMRKALIDGGSSEHLSLFRRLEKLNQEGVIVCPVSETLLDELLRQSDRRTRAATALLMDRLSGSICLQSKYELVRTEIRRQIYRSIKPEFTEAWREWIFTKTGFIHGCKLPYNDSFSEAENSYVQKAFIDACWIGTPVKDTASIADNPKWEHQDNKRFAEAHNKDFKFYRESGASREEIRGQELAFAWHSLYKKEFGEISREIMDAEPDACAQFCTKAASQSGPSLDVMPQMQIQAILSTFFALDHKKTINPTDLPDIDHASYALPYVDIFACDRRLAHAIKAGPHRLDAAYHTTVVGRVAELDDLLDKRF